MSGPGSPVVVFDLGGVVVRICRSLREACERAGLPVRDDLATPEKIAARRRVHAEYETGRISCDEFYGSIAATTGGAYTPEQFRAIHTAWTMGEYPGVFELVTELRGRGVRTGVLSNTNAAHWATLAGQPTLRIIDHPHASHLLGCAKPSPEIYRAFERETGVPGALIVFFDDLEENVAGARAAGWAAHRVDHAGDTASQMRAHLRGHGLLPA